MKKFIVYGLLCLIAMGWVVNAGAQDTLAYWGFNENTGNSTNEAISNTLFSIQTKWPLVERVTGVKQNALRTDGYSTFATGDINTVFPPDSFSVAAWIALESYPVNTAAIWSIFDPSVQRGSYVAIDKFGRLSIGFTIGSQLLKFTSAITVEHYKWNYIVVNVNAHSGTVNAFINGSPVINQNFIAGSLNWPTKKIMLGRSAAVETQDIFPINYLNGILDEIVVRRIMPDSARISREYTLMNPSSDPDLSIPSSRFSGDFHRPKYHPIPQSAWANESHGLLYWGGVYHLFFQKNGNGPFFSQQNWGHLISKDLINWQEKQPALWPQPGFESVGIWSGHCVVNANGVPTIFYTGVDGVRAGIGAATSTDNLMTWNRNPSNPLIPAAPNASYPNKDFRDPYVFKEGTSWYMVIGSGLQSPQTGTVFLYRSVDLLSWQVIGPLFIDQSYLNDPGVFWEMPVFWKFGTKYMLLVNKTPVPGTPARAFYWVGSFANDSFKVDNPRAKNLEVINSLLSPSVNIDDKNRVVAIGIIPDLLPGSEQYKQGWANLFSLPRIWKMVNDTLQQSPHPNLDQSRGALSTRDNVTLIPGGSGYLKTKGFQLEIKATIYPGSSARVGFILEKNDNNSEFTRIYYDYTTTSMVVDRSRSSANTSTPRDIQTEQLILPPGQPIDWHLYIDGSVIEVFINNRWAFATRVYPVSTLSNGVDLFTEGENATVTNIQLWNRGDLVTGIFDSSRPVLTSLKVWPVPAKKQCYIQLPRNEGGRLSLTIYDMNGKLVNKTEQYLNPSTPYVVWNLQDDNGRGMASGNYYGLISINRKQFYQARLLIMR